MFYLVFYTLQVVFCAETCVARRGGPVLVHRVVVVVRASVKLPISRSTCSSQDEHTPRPGVTVLRRYGDSKKSRAQEHWTTGREETP